jgi:large subunit ribosomal protein L9e
MKNLKNFHHLLSLNRTAQKYRRTVNEKKKMKYIRTDQSLAIPKGVTVQIKARKIAVTGPRGSLSKNLRHIDVTFTKVSAQEIQITVHNGDRKHVAALRTVKSLISNMITGVTKGYKYKMRYVYAHFPINVNTVDKDGDKFIEIRNFLGDKQVRLVKVREGVDVEFSANQKDEIVLSGNSVENVSQTCADVQQICRVRNKDIRKFLDGIYVSEKGTIVQDD